MSLSRDERVRKTFFSPHATALRKLRQNIRHNYDNSAQIEAKLSCCSSQKLKERDSALFAKLIKEYTMLVRPGLISSDRWYDGHRTHSTICCL